MVFPILKVTQRDLTGQPGRHIHTLCKEWISIEQHVAEGDLSTIPWLTLNDTSKSFRPHPLIGSMLQCFQNTLKVTTISTVPGPLTPIYHNPRVPSGCFLRLPHLPDPLPRAHKFFSKGLERFYVHYLQY